MFGPAGSADPEDPRRRAVGYTGMVGIERFLGVDLAWRDGLAGTAANESGVVAIDGDGHVLDAGWTRGAAATAEWVDTAAGDHPALVFIDAPVVIDNPAGQRLCERQVGQRYGRWRVSANTTNLGSPRRAGVTLRELLQTAGWRYSDGWAGPPSGGRSMSECYPYTTLVGAPELGYDVDGERPRYKRKPRSQRMEQWRLTRAAACDELVRRMDRLRGGVPPLLLRSHPLTRQLLDEPSPTPDAAYKHREDLIDALLCAWTAALWAVHGASRCQVLGDQMAEYLSEIRR